jgi:hypothetical protein
MTENLKKGENFTKKLIEGKDERVSSAVQPVMLRNGNTCHRR